MLAVSAGLRSSVWVMMFMSAPAVLVVIQPLVP